MINDLCVIHHVLHVYRNTAVDRCAKINLPKPICKKTFFSIIFLKFHILLRETKQWHQQLQSRGRIDEACHTYRKQGPFKVDFFLKLFGMMIDDPSRWIWL